MRASVAIAAVSLALLGFGCGGEDADVTAPPPVTTTEVAPPPIVADRDDPRFATISPGKGPKPKIDPPDLPPPKQLLVRDLEVGTGPVARRGDEVAVWYLAVGYETGRQAYFTWRPMQPYVFELGAEKNGKGFERGVEGMRVGGRREIVIPAKLAFGYEPLDYLVELKRIEPPSRPPRGG